MSLPFDDMASYEGAVERLAADPPVDGNPMYSPPFSPYSYNGDYPDGEEPDL